MSLPLELRLPRLDEHAEWLAAHRATSPEVPNFLHHYVEGMSLVTYLDVLADRSAGRGLADGQVPSTFLFAFVGGRIVGRVAVRHTLTAPLLHAGGHIGYAVVPEFRRRGYGTEILRQALGVAHDRLGLTRVLLTCHDDNAGSIRIIERNGGVLENVVDDLDGARRMRRYWISLPRTAAV